VMVNAGSYFGNSGGALFRRETGELMGVPSRLSGIRLGFGVDMITFMGFAAHPERIYEFLEEQECQFIHNKEDSYYDAMERREQRQKQAMLDLKAQLVEQGEA